MNDETKLMYYLCVLYKEPIEDEKLKNFKLTRRSSL